MGTDRVDVAADGGRAGAPDEGFRGAQVCTLVGITYRQLDYWARTDLLRPSITDATGSGSQRRYSYSDVLELKVIKRLLDAGLKLQQARQAVECLRGRPGCRPGLVPAGAGREAARCWPTPTATSSTCWPAVRGSSTSCPLSGVVSELEAAIVEINAAAPAPHHARRAIRPPTTCRRPRPPSVEHDVRGRYRVRCSP